MQIIGPVMFQEVNLVFQRDCINDGQKVQHDRQKDENEEYEKKH